MVGLDNKIQLNGLINREGKRKELSCIEYPFKCNNCGNDLFIPVHQLQKIKLESEETLRPKSDSEYYICSSCQKIFINY